MEANKSSFIFQSLHTLFSKGFNLALALAAGIVSARLLGPEGKGVVAYLQALSFMIIPLGDLGVRQATAYLVGQKKYPEQDIYANMRALYVVTASLSVLILLSVYMSLGIFSKYGVLIPLTFLGIVPLTLFESYHNGILIAKKQIQRMNYTQLADKGLTLLFLVLMLAGLKLDVLGAGISYFLAKLVSVILLMLWIGKLIQSRPRFTKNICQEMLKKGFVFAAALFLIQLNYRFDVLILEKLKGAYSVGIYSVGVNICELLKELPLAIGLVLFSRSANWNVQDVKNSLTKTLFLSRVVLFLMVCFAVALGIVSQFMIPFLYGESFKASVGVTLVLLPGIVMLSVFLILSLFAAGQGKPQLSLFVFTPAFLLNVVLNFVLIPKFDSLGAALSSTFSYSFAAVLYAYLFKRLFGSRLGEAFFPTLQDMRFLLSSFRKG